MAREYELMVVLTPDTEAEEVPEKLDGLRALVTDNGGAVSEMIDWGRRRLAYPIQRHFEGHYLIAQFTAEGGPGNQQLERALRLDESVLRHLIIRTDD